MNSEVLMGQPYDFVTSGESTANADVTVTQAAPDADKQHVVQGVLVSVSAAPAAGGVKVEVIQDAAGTPVTLMHFRISAGTTSPVFIPLKGLKVAKGKSVSVKVPALGGTTIGSATVMGMTRFAQI
jgi:hypothetical protein